MKPTKTIELLIDIPVEPAHGLTKGRVMKVARMAKPTESPTLFVVGDLAVEVGLISSPRTREYKYVEVAE